MQQAITLYGRLDAAARKADPQTSSLYLLST
jgi:hypothetical protein